MKSFSDLSISPAIMRAIQELGYTTPSPIQAESLPILLGEPTDFMGLAATGTGKTAAFSIPLLERIDPNIRAVQGLILCPTRELALQVAGQINLLGKYKDIQALPIYGGSGYGEQIAGIRNGMQVVVGTPGRLVDHIENGRLKLDNLKAIILDEADEMISMGFKEDLETILAGVNREKTNTWLFSATMSREVRGVADKFLKNPRQVHVNRTEVVPSTVEQLYYMTQESNKPEVLCKIMDAAEGFYGLIFCQTKALVSDLSQYLSERGYKVDSLHGDKDQKSRERTMQAFRDHKVKILICTDVASRGLDVKDITHVINYSLPRELDNYVHRIGRTARSGKTGFAMSLVTPSHRRLIAQIERVTKSRMIEGKIPTRKEIGTKKVSKIMSQFNEQTAFNRAVELMDPSLKEALSKMTPEEVAGRFLSLTFPEIFAETLEVQIMKTVKPRYEERTRPGRSSSEERVRPVRRGSSDERPTIRPVSSEDRGPRGFEARGPRNFEPRGPRNFEERGPRSSEDRGPRRFDDRGGSRPAPRGPGGFAPRSPRWAGKPPRIEGGGRDERPKRFGPRGAAGSPPKERFFNSDDRAE